jgi:hypothetical protein
MLCATNGGGQMSAAEEVKEISVNIFNTILKSSADSAGTFRVLMTAKIEEKEKPLLVVGNAHASFEDGHCIAVLNPDENVLDKVQGGVHYHGGLLKETVQGKCDLMIELWIDAYKEDGVSVMGKYQARGGKEAKFEVR